jgi:hypothetical protein
MTDMIEARDSRLLWNPTTGEEWSRLTRRLLKPTGDLDAETLAKFENDCRRILGSCAPPDEPAPEARTGLVLGQVQSGKTMSFTGVSSLARDNGYKLVIVITGISVQLLNQSAGRLRDDLGIEGNTRAGWVHVPVEPDAPIESIRDALVRQLELWTDPETLPHLRKAVLVTVMKNHSNLARLTTALRAANSLLSGGLRSVPTMIIDDEADQASLNTKVRAGELSTVYQRISDLRRALPNHSMLQYTATPQAPLLLNIADILSPDFCHVLDPGPDYTGGRTFFIDNSSLVRPIPSDELGSNSSPPATVPASLHDAMCVFVLGVAMEIQRPDYQTRSMLVHPSSQTGLHSVFVQWVRGALDLWRRLLKQPEGDLDRQELLADFRKAHADLSRTVPDLLEFDRLAPQLKQALLQIRVEEVNAAQGATPIIKWEMAPAWILVGGQALDRGFTVKGLTVSYMPRPLATAQSNADTLQQRARFFGYKRSYIGYCRIWLENAVKDAFTDYVQHEDEVRRSLRQFERLDRPLSEWRRRFILDGSMAPTRRNVIDIDWSRSIAGTGAVMLRHPHFDEQACFENRQLIREFHTKGAWHQHGDVTLSPYQRHLVCDTQSLRSVCESFLTRYRTSSLADAEALNARLLQCSTILGEDADAPCDVYLMSHAAPDRRKRTVNASGELDQFLQGANPSTGGRAEYPGDRGICRPDRVSIQIHILDIELADKTVMVEVPTLAIFAPNAAPVIIVTQPQGRHST